MSVSTSESRSTGIRRRPRERRLALAGRRHRRRQRHRRRVPARLPALEHRLPRYRARCSSRCCPGLQGLLAGPGCSPECSARSSSASPAPRIYTEVVAAAVSALSSSATQWGAFLTHRGRARPGARRRDRLPAVPLPRWRSRSRSSPARARGSRGGINDLVLWYAGADTAFIDRLPRLHVDLAAPLIAGALSWLLARGLAATGALDRSRRGAKSRARASERRDARRCPASLGRGVEARGWGWRHAHAHAWAVRDASFRIEPGERVLLLGASGSGKSTLLHGLAGVLGGDDEGEQPGELLIDGVPAAQARGRAGLVLQDPDSQVDPRARRRRRRVRLREPRRAARPRSGRGCGAALDAVGLDVPLDRPDHGALAAGRSSGSRSPGVLAMRPGADPARRADGEPRPRRGVAEVRDAVTARARDPPAATLVVVEHRVDVWLPLVDRVIVLGRRAVSSPTAAPRPCSRDGAGARGAGVWVPGIPPGRPAGAGTPARVPTLLSAESARRSQRVAGHRRWRPASTSRCAQAPSLAITGPNGVGKSTLGLTLAGLLAPGSAAPLDRSPLDSRRGAGRDPIRWASRQLLTRIGTVFQDPEHQLLATTVREELEVGPRALGLGADRDRRRASTNCSSGCGSRRSRAPTRTRSRAARSGGSRSRRRSRPRPRVLVLDEPTFGQDARTWAELVALLARLRDDGSRDRRGHPRPRRRRGAARRASSTLPVPESRGGGAMTILDAHARTGRDVAASTRSRSSAPSLLITAAARAHARPRSRPPSPSLLELLLSPLAGLGWREFWVAHAADRVDRSRRSPGSPSRSTARRAARCTSTGSSCASARARSRSPSRPLFRVLAIALPAVVLFVDRRPDRSRRRARPGAQAAGALRARRARRAAAGRAVHRRLARARARAPRARRRRRGRVRRFLGMAFALLVLSIRRGSKLATAMEARGFGGPARAPGRASPASAGANGC